MAIIDTTSENKFDPVIRGDKADSLLAFIYATDRASSNDENRREEIAKRVKDGFNLFRTNRKGSTSGAGSYGDEKSSKSINDQFQSQYTMGMEMGIWTGADLQLNELAKQVASNKITVSTYISTVFLNLFAYYNIDQEKKYIHFLYEVLSIIKDQSLENKEVSIEQISQRIPAKREQITLLMRYLEDTDFFVKSSKENLKLCNQYNECIDELIDMCNLEYEECDYDKTVEYFKNKRNYADYVTKIPKINNKKKVNRVKEQSFVNYYTGLQSNYSRNRILFGAPGTGKSYKLNKEKDDLLSNGGEFERITFHPDYSYANFVGTYKPVPYLDNDNKQAITYEYVAGPFIQILVKALQNSKTNKIEPYVLIIEEINRANVAAVFGDVFQLLDRGDDGVSEYSITTSKDLRVYLAKEENLGGNPEDYKEIKIPDNMFIWATMNSADQGVFPMDTAFKRRWDFSYIGINENEEGIKGKIVKLGEEGYTCTVEWNELRKAINKELLKYKVNEDKLMGPYFISKKSLGDDREINSKQFTNVFKNKVLMYLFDDAAKQKRPSLFAGCSEKNLYSVICNEFDTKGVAIFCEEIRNQFIDTLEEE